MTLKQLHEITFVEVASLQSNRFSFIQNEDLKENICIASQYIAFLFDLSNSYSVPGSVKYSIYKTIVIYAASITEGLLHYCLDKMSNSKPSKTKEYKNIKSIYKLDNGDELFLCSKKITEREWCDVKFDELNRTAKKENIIDQGLYDKCDLLRKQRNKIHIGDLSAGDDLFELQEIKVIFETLGVVILKVKSFTPTLPTPPTGS